MGFVDDETKYLEMTKAMAFIMWNVEDFGITIVESLACGTPVIAYKAGGALDIVQEGVNGIFFEEQKEMGLINGTEELGKMKVDIENKKILKYVFKGYVYREDNHIWKI